MKTSFMQAGRLGCPNGAFSGKYGFQTLCPELSGGILAFARGLGEFGATAMIAGNIAGETRTLPLAVYSAVSAGNMEEAYQYVWILVIISFLVVTGMNAVTHGFQKFSRR